MLKSKKIDWLAVFIGSVFLGASVYRMFHYDIALNEFLELGISTSLLPAVIVLEFTMGLLFILNKKVRCTSMVAIIFLIIAIALATAGNFAEVVNSMPVLFIFNADSTDIFLHVTYVVILLAIFNRYRGR